MLVRMTKLFLLGNLTDSLTLDSQKDIKVFCLGQIALPTKETSIPVGGERGEQW